MSAITGVLWGGGKEKWVWVYLASAVIYLAYFEVWIWLPFHIEPFVSGARIVDRASWLVGHPGLLYMTLLFPLFLVAVGILASMQLARRRPHAF